MTQVRLIAELLSTWYSFPLLLLMDASGTTMNKLTRCERMPLFVDTWNKKTKTPGHEKEHNSRSSALIGFPSENINQA